MGNNPICLDKFYQATHAGLMLFQCTECNAQMIEDGDITTPEFKFCPFCGVKFTAVTTSMVNSGSIPE